MCVECGEGKGPAVMGLSCAGQESEPLWAPGFQATSGLTVGSAWAGLPRGRSPHAALLPGPSG